MAWNGAGTFTRTNGTYSGANVWASDQGAGQNITASRFDTHDQDIATGINNCLTKDGQNGATANLSLGGYRYLNAGLAAARTDLSRADQLQDDTLNWGGTSGGAGGAYTITLTPAPAALTTGMRIAFLTNHTAAVAGATVNVNGLGAKILINTNTSGHPANSFLSNNIIEARYDGTYFRVTSPLGREKTSFTPSPVGNGAMTLTPVTVTRADYILDPISRTCEVFLNFSGTIGGTPDDEIQVTLPFAGSTAFANGDISLQTDGSGTIAVQPFGGTTTTLVIAPFNLNATPIVQVNYTAGAFTMRLNYRYTIA